MKGQARREVSNSINSSVRQLEGHVTHRPGCHLTRAYLRRSCSPRVTMMTNVIDIFFINPEMIKDAAAECVSKCPVAWPSK